MASAAGLRPRIGAVEARAHIARAGDRSRGERMSDTITRRVSIRGRVQGVGFRAHVEHAALTHGVEGWVRNRRDGSVEAVLSGSADAVTAVIDATRQGPPGARV